jgi:hypothetical protein
MPAHLVLVEPTTSKASLDEETNVLGRQNRLRSSFHFIGCTKSFHDLVRAGNKPLRRTLA